MLRRTLSVFLTVVLAISSYVRASPASAMCVASGEGTPATAVKVWTTAISTIYNIFPIKIGGVTIVSFSGLEDFSSVGNMPVCICTDPLPRIGIKVSLWEPIAFIETTKIPSCFPSLGMSVPLPSAQGQTGFGGQDEGPDDSANHHTYQVHWIKFPVFSVLELFLDFVCLEKGGVDLSYIAEVDPLWQNDVWASILNPEAILVSNPIAQMACMADSAAANLGFPLDFLWWCLGSWGSLYPFTKSYSQGSNLTAQMGVSVRMIAKLHRQMMLWGSVGEAGLCGMYPMPILRKSQYSLLPLHPVPNPVRVPIGRSEMIQWGSGKEAPLVNHHVYVNAVYRKRDCCAF